MTPQRRRLVEDVFGMVMLVLLAALVLIFLPDMKEFLLP